jgi:hypothetical protein
MAFYITRMAKKSCNHLKRHERGFGENPVRRMINSAGLILMQARSTIQISLFIISLAGKDGICIKSTESQHL